MEMQNVQPPVVLVVEDDGIIRELIVVTLEEGGFSVKQASTLEKAMALIEDPGARYRALVTDIDLDTKKAGWELARRARELHPELPVIYVTGGGAAEWPSNGVPKSVLITKPFAEGQLVTAVSQLLNDTAIG